MNTGTTLSMGTKICAGIVPELRWTATAPSGTRIDPKHKGSMKVNCIRQRQAHESMSLPPILFKAHIIHILLPCCEFDCLSTIHSTRVNVRTAIRREAISMSVDTTPSHKDSIPNRPARSQSLYRLSYRTHIIRCNENKQRALLYSVLTFSVYIFFMFC